MRVSEEERSVRDLLSSRGLGDVYKRQVMCNDFMAFTLSLALDPTFGIHSLKTLDTAQPCHLLKTN